MRKAPTLVGPDVHSHTLIFIMILSFTFAIVCSNLLSIGVVLDLKNLRGYQYHFFCSIYNHVLEFIQRLSQRPHRFEPADEEQRVKKSESPNL